MKTVMERDTIKTITTHYIDGEFVASHGARSWISSVRRPAK